MCACACVHVYGPDPTCLRPVLCPLLSGEWHISLYGMRRLQPQSRQEPHVLEAVRKLQHLLAKARKQPFLCHYRVTNVDKEEKMTNHVYLKYRTAKMNIFFPRRKGPSLRSLCLGRHVKNGLMATQSPTCPDGAGTTPRNQALQRRARPAIAFEPQMDPQSPGAEHMLLTPGETKAGRCKLQKSQFQLIDCKGKRKDDEGSCAQRRFTERSDRCHGCLLQTDSTRPSMEWQRHLKTAGNASVLF